MLQFETAPLAIAIIFIALVFKHDYSKKLTIKQENLSRWTMSLRYFLCTKLLPDIFSTLLCKLLFDLIKALIRRIH